MPRPVSPRSTSPRATATRDALYLAGLRRFASDGWRTARVRDIVADAGQGNDSAINYHFGGRAGLLREVLDRGVLRMEAERRADLRTWVSSPPDLAEMLREEGYQVIAESGDGESAIELARDLRPSLVVMDIKMPKVDGISAAAVRNEPDE